MKQNFPVIKSQSWTFVKSDLQLQSLYSYPHDITVCSRRLEVLKPENVDWNNCIYFCMIRFYIACLDIGLGDWATLLMVTTYLKCSKWENGKIQNFPGQGKDFCDVNAT